MKAVNRLLTLLSLTAVVITLERVSPTTRILLPPRDFLHLHELVQMGLISAFSVVVTFVLLRVISDGFRQLQDGRGMVLGTLFILGTYFYATGNGAHEVASFLFNQYCYTSRVGVGVCGSLYVDDYYFGNIVYFLGLGLSNLALILLELRRPDETYGRRDFRITLINAGVLALTFIAYDAFDRVAVGLVATIVYAVVFTLLLLRSNALFRSVPFTLYSAAGFALAAAVAIPLRLALAL
ncbi:MAG TPA: hypothetical protein VFB58_18055 [Chloroflexota bacterium]|nr:hypothetical protein [Chloroflexota bacterium]